MLKLVWNFLFRTTYRRMTIQALALSAVARARIRLVPGGKLYRYMGDEKGETEMAPLPLEARKHVARVAYKVMRVADRTPWESRCLVRAMVAQRMLRSRGLSSTLYLGIMRGREKDMAAHAWLRCGDYYVTGGDGSEYASVASFIMRPRQRGDG